MTEKNTRANSKKKGGAESKAPRKNSGSAPKGKRNVKAQPAPRLGGSTIKGFSPLSGAPAPEAPALPQETAAAKKPAPAHEKAPAPKDSRKRRAGKTAPEAEQVPQFSGETEVSPGAQDFTLASEDAALSENDELNDLLDGMMDGTAPVQSFREAPEHDPWASGPESRGEPKNASAMPDAAGMTENLSQEDLIILAAGSAELDARDPGSNPGNSLSKEYISKIQKHITSLSGKQNSRVSPDLVRGVIKNALDTGTMKYVASGRDRWVLVSAAEVTARVIFDNEQFGPSKMDCMYVMRAELENGALTEIRNQSGMPLFHGDLIKGCLNARKTVFYVSSIAEYHNSVVGRVMKRYKGAVLTADDPRFGDCHFVFPSAADLGDAVMGSVVICDITERESPKSFKVRTARVLGDLGQLDVQIQLAVLRSGIPHKFGTKVIEQTRNIPDEVPESDKQNRRDIRDLPLVTIDGEDARDFDDAVYCRREDGGFRLWVAIADVSYYVRPDTPLDVEAAKRGNSVYFPNYVVPMLPEKLSNGLCSLNPHADRLCFVCEVFVSKSGDLGEYSFYQAVMRSHARLTYTNVAAMIDGQEPEDEFKPLLPHIRDLHDLYRVLKEARQRRGTVDFESEEVRFVFDENLKLTNIVPLVRNDAHMLIEECMIAANICAAKLVSEAQGHTLYRVHAAPSISKLASFRAFIEPLGYHLDGDDHPEPADYARLAESFKDSPNKKLLSVMMLRSMSLAEYSPVNQGHFGLALRHYAHFTSPIRRYPDLVLHREIKHLLGESGHSCGARSFQDPELLKIAEQCNETERRADRITGEVARSLKARFMEQFLGKSLPGVISNVESFGIFVEIPRFHVDGLVHITAMGVSDYLIYNRDSCSLTGEVTGISFRIGDPVTVRIDEVDVESGKINMTLVSGKGRKGKKNRTPETAGNAGTKSGIPVPEITAPEITASGLAGDEVNQRIVASLDSWSQNISGRNDGENNGETGSAAGDSAVSEAASASAAAPAPEKIPQASSADAGKKEKTRGKKSRKKESENAVPPETAPESKPAPEKAPQTQAAIDDAGLEKLLTANPEFRETYAAYLKEKEALSVQEENVRKQQEKVAEMRQALIRHFVSTVL